VFRALVADWDRVAVSRRYRRQLSGWARSEQALGVVDGHALVRAGRSRDQRLACDVLEALARLAQSGEDLALRSAVQVLLPRLSSIADSYWRPGLDAEERAAMVIAVANEEIVRCRPGTAGTPFDFRLWSNIRKRFGRQVAADDRASHHLVLADTAELDRAAGATDLDLEPDQAALARWVVERAGVDARTARMIVLTRIGGVAVHELSGPGRTPDALRKRRARAEAKLRRALELGMAPLDRPLLWCA
jgi:hypothetical protein